MVSMANAYQPDQAYVALCQALFTPRHQLVTSISLSLTRTVFFSGPPVRSSFEVKSTTTGYANVFVSLKKNIVIFFRNRMNKVQNILFIRTIRKARNWATDIEIIAAAAFFNTPLFEFTVRYIVNHNTSMKFIIAQSRISSMRWLSCGRGPLVVISCLISLGNTKNRYIIYRIIQCHSMI